MDLLLYFGSYAAVVTLFMSGVVAVGWTAFKAVQSVVRLYRAVRNLDIEEDMARRVPADYQLAHLKRAGQ